MPALDATSFELRWPEDAMTAIVDAWQHLAPDADDGVAASLLVTAPADPDRPAAVTVFGAMAGSESEARDTLEGLVARAAYANFPDADLDAWIPPTTAPISTAS